MSLCEKKRSNNGDTGGGNDATTKALQGTGMDDDNDDEDDHIRLLRVYPKEIYNSSTSAKQNQQICGSPITTIDYNFDF